MDNYKTVDNSICLCGNKWFIIFIEWEIVEYTFYPQFTINMLIGEYIHIIDNKNRISLPAKFRREMGKKIIITPGLDNCLFVFTLKEWNKISEKLSESSML